MNLLRTLFLASLLLAPAAHAAADPVAPVLALHEALVQVMKQGDKTACAARIERMTQAVADSFDMPFLAKFVVRKHWANLTTEQQRDFVAALQRMTASTYASEFKSFDNEKFENGQVEDLGKDKKVVRTQLIIPNDTPVHFDYMLKQTDGRWRIINVIANGVSDIAIRSAQYDRLIKDKGFDALMAQLKAQNERMALNCLTEKK